jgi:replicative DNA helicase
MEHGRTTSLRLSSKGQKLIPRELSDGLGKLPPQDIDHEEGILGSMLSEKTNQSEVLGFLKPEHFYLETHKVIFEAISDLANEQMPIDMRTVKVKLEKKGHLELVGGAYYIAQLTTKASGGANIMSWAAHVYDLYLKRQLIQLGAQMQSDAYEAESDPHEMLARFENLIKEEGMAIPKNSEVTMGHLLTEATTDIQARENEESGLVGVPSGFQRVDAATLGWGPGWLIILAARPGMGKTAFIIQSLRNAAVDFKIPVALFSIEMPAKEIGMRAASIETGIPLVKLRQQKFEPLDWTNWTHKTAKLAGSPFYIDDSPYMTISDFRRKARRLKALYNVQLIAVDYLQLMSGEEGDRGNREQEISSISRGLKAVAKELNIPIIALSQLSRSVEQRGGDKIPQLSDLRESGSLEQDADLVGFLWRPGYYKIKGDDGGEFIDGLMRFIIKKFRHGAQAEIPLRFIPNLTAFENTEEEYYGKSLPPLTKKQPAQLSLDPNNRIEPTTLNDDAPF